MNTRPHDLATIRDQIASEYRPLSEREFHFATDQYCLLANRVTELQKEREQWVRHSILATFAFFGWVSVNSLEVAQAFMLGADELQLIYVLPLLFNLGGAIRFFFIQREINRIVNFLMELERTTLRLPEWMCNQPNGRGIRDRHWHAPSIWYWALICVSSGVAAIVRGIGVDINIPMMGSGQ